MVKTRLQPYEFKRKQESAVCLDCMEDWKGELDDWAHHFCESCQCLKPQIKFTMTERQRHFFRKPHCVDCNQTQRGGGEKNTRKEPSYTVRNVFQYVPAGHITEKQRQHHLSKREDRLLCYECHEKRTTYTRSRCGHTGVREVFQKTHFERDCERGTQQCVECKSGRRKGMYRCAVQQVRARGEIVCERKAPSP